jgi:CheY-like chemotaxis protein
MILPDKHNGTAAETSILIVDDNPKNLQILGNYLQNEGYHVEFAMEGDSALKWVERMEFDLILLDIMMPGRDGYDVCKMIKSVPVKQKIPIIFLTAKTDTESIIKGFDAGAVDYITKPFNQKELLARVRTQIELKKNRDEIAKNLEDIEYKNKLITYSIQYARTIQSAVIKASQNGSAVFKELLFLYLPRNIVSGDFYWFHNTGREILAGVFDCTGHGIPGAFMSILGITLLNETVIRECITDPPLILNRLREKIIEALGQKGESLEVKDGMDGAIISYELKTKTLVYSGAYNPVYILRNNDIIELKGDKMPLAYSDNLSDFSFRKMILHPDDIIYLFTDGYKDQFGGQDMKKLGICRFRELLIGSHKNPLETQKQLLLDAFNNWKGNEEQVDDITVVGLKL